ncbi:nitroreductase family protein [Streptomyces sp. NPDC015220]|uniref:nitroreductase family protein n=1 Tax=Streptomyces sp. NPDC015220 TaxID=3364947 RepID=UPI0036FB33F3
MSQEENPMDVFTAVLTRRSAKRLVGPAPGDEEFRYLLQTAATAPDHGVLRPWRWILVRGQGLHTVVDGLAEEDPAVPRQQLVDKVVRAPLKAMLVFRPRVGHRVPEWEQLAAASAMTHALLLLLHARGYAAIWRTGRLCTSRTLPGTLGLADGERLLGALDIGSPDPASGPQRRRSPVDVTDHVATLV